MDDLISRQVAIDAIRKIYDSVGILGEKWAVDKCQMAIKDLPSAQPERARGEWKIEHVPYMVGSKNLVEIIICSNCGYVLQGYPSKFCPNCGADMRCD